MKISEILEKYETDKVKGHNYGDVYDQVFDMFDKTGDLNILEIGVQKGGSLRAWKEYFENVKIYGIDIVDVRKEEYKHKDIFFILSDVRKVELDKNFDIIIDDGSHLFEDVEFVVKKFLSSLNKGGIMVIEDVQHPESWVYNIRRVLPVGFSLETRDLRNIQGNYDDFIILIKKQ